MIQPALDMATFAERRVQLLDKLPEQSYVVLFAPSLVHRNADNMYPFRQESYFWYLTGFPEPDAIAILTKKNGESFYILFSAKRDKTMEIWTGKIIGQQGACDDYAADDAYALEEIEKIPEILSDAHRIYSVLGLRDEWDNAITDILRDIHAATGRGGAPIEGIFDVRRNVDEMRMFKTISEQNLLHKAGRISAAGHRAGMVAARPGAYEYTVQAAIEAEFIRHAGSNWSFPSIVAGGINACCLHYTTNSAPLKSGDLVLLDAGAEYAGYAGDISRTFPINGKFSRNQQALYEIVLAAQKRAIDCCKPNIRHLELHRQTGIDLIQGMIDLKIIDGNAEELVDSGEAKRFYPHGTGHWLGLDVHDVGIYKPDGIHSRKYAPNMVVTIEPGLYLQPDDLSIAEEWRGIGIRIEDDVIITDDKPEITSSEAPKEIRDLEKLLANRE